MDMRLDSFQSRLHDLFHGVLLNIRIGVNMKS
jgi:hypothetical protein